MKKLFVLFFFFFFFDTFSIVRAQVTNTVNASAQGGTVKIYSKSEINGENTEVYLEGKDKVNVQIKDGEINIIEDGGGKPTIIITQTEEKKTVLAPVNSFFKKLWQKLLNLINWQV